MNNAGYGLAGAMEELDEARVPSPVRRELLRASLVHPSCPSLHACTAERPHIPALDPGAAMNAPSNLSAYNASKSAVEAISDSLSQEVESFGIKVTILEPGPFRSDWNGTSMDRAEPMPAYDAVLAERRSALSGESAFTQPGDPAPAAQAVLTVLDSGSHRCGCCWAGGRPMWRPSIPASPGGVGGVGPRGAWGRFRH